MKQPTKENKIRRFLVALMLALESIYKTNPPEKEKVVVVVRQKDKDKR